MKTRDWGGPCSLKRLGGRAYGGKDFLGGRDPQGHHDERNTTKNEVFRGHPQMHLVQDSRFFSIF